MSVVRYGLAIYCPIRVTESDPHPSSIEGIKVAFNDMLRLLCGVKKSDRMSIKAMLEKLNWLSINQLAAEVRLCVVWKAVHDCECSLSHLFPKFESSTLPTRAMNTQRLKNCVKTTLRENSFKYPSVVLWNLAPENVTTAENEKKAKKAIRAFVKTLPL